MNTVLAYFEDTYKFQDHAILVGSGKDENGDFLLLDRTIFYPQGGGQPSDQGTITVDDLIIPIHLVKNVGNEVKHYTGQDYGNLVGKTATCSIDQKKRLLHARLHTSGHLIANVVEKFYSDWVAVKGHHFPDQAYVEFASKNGDLEDLSLDLIHEEIEKLIHEDSPIKSDQVSGSQVKELCPNLPYTIPSDQPVRITAIGEFPFSPCGGTHIKSLEELKGLEITKCKIKNNALKVSYHISNKVEERMSLKHDMFS